MSDLVHVGEGLEKLLRRLGMVAPVDLGRLVDEWAQLAGDPWATRAVPVGLQRGELVLEVADGTDASLLKYQVGTLVERLERELGGRMVEAVRIRVASPRKSR